MLYRKALGRIESRKISLGLCMGEMFSNWIHSEVAGIERVGTKLHSHDTERTFSCQTNRSEDGAGLKTTYDSMLR
jgi:hypothetical protein